MMINDSVYVDPLALFEMLDNCLEQCQEIKKDHDAFSKLGEIALDQKEHSEGIAKDVWGLVHRWSCDRKKEAVLRKLLIQEE